MPLRVQSWGNIGELGPVRCDKLFAYWWWKIWYEWGVLVACCLALAIGGKLLLQPLQLAGLCMQFNQKLAAANEHKTMSTSRWKGIKSESILAMHGTCSNDGRILYAQAVCMCSVWRWLSA